LASNNIVGNNSSNILNGAGGTDRLEGRWGNDTYIVDSIDDVIIEKGPISDIDTVQSSVSWTLGENLENLVLVGADNTTGLGNRLNNSIVGNIKNNVLDGGSGGVDTLTGLEGADIFKLSTRPTSINASTADRITDFSKLDGDRIAISKSSYNFKNQSISLAIANSESSVTSALRGSATFVYNNKTGELIWNENGSKRGFGRGGTICILTNQPLLNSSDLYFY